VDRKQLLDSLDFDNHRFFHKQIEPVGTGQPLVKDLANLYASFDFRFGRRVDFDGST
jgi:hypothetical protein